MGQRVEFPSNGHTCQGYFAAPESGNGPAVVVIQEWWGLVPHIEDLVNRFASGRNAFERPRDTLRFAILAAVLSPAVSATIGVSSLALGGFARWADFGTIWLTWWLGDMGGALVVAPLLVLWIGQPRPRWARAQTIEAACLLVALLVVGQLVFGSSGSGGVAGHPLKFLCMPLLAWVAFRFDQRDRKSVV